MNTLDDLVTVFGNDEKAKNNFRVRIAHQFSTSSLLEFSSCMNMLLSIVFHILCKRRLAPNVQFILRALEILTRLSQVPENSIFIGACPDEILVSLVELLHPADLDDLTSISGGGGGALDSALSPDMELELRNAALEALHSMCTVSTAVAIALGKVPRVADRLFGILMSLASTANHLSTSSTPTVNVNYNFNPEQGASATLPAMSGSSAFQYNASVNSSAVAYGTAAGMGMGVGMNSRVSEGGQRAAQLLGLLLALPEHELLFKSLRVDLYVAACYDEQIAGNQSA